MLEETVDLAPSETAVNQPMGIDLSSFSPKSTLYRDVLRAAVGGRMDQFLQTLYASSLKDLKELHSDLKMVSGEYRFDKKAIEKRIGFESGNYVSISPEIVLGTEQSVTKVFLFPEVYNLVRLVDPDHWLRANGGMRVNMEALNSKGDLEKRSVTIARAGHFDRSDCHSAISVAYIVASILEGNIQNGIVPNPRMVLSFVGRLLEGHIEREQLVILTALGWCQLSEKLAVTKSDLLRSSEETRLSLSQLVAVPNKSLKGSSSGFQRRYSDEFLSDSPEVQYKRLLSQRALSGYKDVIRNGCPLEIPLRGAGLIEPLCWLERRIGAESGQPYLSAQCVWTEEQHSGFKVLFVARYHSLHRDNYPLKCPTMRVTRIIPESLSNKSIAPRQYLVNQETPDLTRAIADSNLQGSILEDANGHQWLSIDHLEDAVRKFPTFINGSNYSIGATLLSATHFAYYSKRMLDK